MPPAPGNRLHRARPLGRTGTAIQEVCAHSWEDLDTWLAGQNDPLVRRIIIPAELKWEVRDKLDQSNITERVLFPGLDGLSRWLRRHCTPRTVPLKDSDSPVE